MKFYSREQELQLLERDYSQTDNSSTMTVITGRRRIGKTLLAKKFAENKKHLYLFISKKNEVLLCKEFLEIITSQFNFPVFGEIKDFRTIFRLLMEIGKSQKIIVIIDEFQEFYSINNSIYSEIQNIWDENKDKSKVHLIFIGSIYSLMNKIFKNSKEPLFGRADRIIYLKPFSPKTIRAILEDNGNYSKENLFINYLITGGVPRYQEILVKNGIFSKEKLLEFYFEKSSPFIDEGKTILIEEFGKEYGTYFSILELLSEGRTSRSEIESILEKNIGGYLENLIEDFNIVAKRQPVGAKATGKIQKYYINDNFLNFWFRFVYKYRSSIENNNFEFLKNNLEKSLSTYSGAILERLYHEIFRNQGKFTAIGTYWERGNANEIDIVCVDEANKRLIIGEIKLNKDKLRLAQLQAKSKNLEKRFPDYEFEYLELSLDDVEGYLASE
ncbi:MAG: AAA family ATPase [Spirochaetales bacterium]|nr:AAA family ATPase [Spirochaetales bacterium]